jgi:hypothetical protein
MHVIPASLSQQPGYFNTHDAKAALTQVTPTGLVVHVSDCGEMTSHGEPRERDCRRVSPELCNSCQLSQPLTFSSPGCFFPLKSEYAHQHGTEKKIGWRRGKQRCQKAQ